MNNGFQESDSERKEKNINTEDGEYGNIKNSVDAEQGEAKTEKEAEKGQENYEKEAQAAFDQGREADSEAQTAHKKEKEACGQEKNSGETLRKKISEGGAESSYGYAPPRDSDAEREHKRKQKQKKGRYTLSVGLIAVIASLAILVTSVGGIFVAAASNGLLLLGNLLGNIQIWHNGQEIIGGDSQEGDELPEMNITKNDGSIDVNIQVGSTGYSEDMTIPQVVELVADTVVEITTTNVVTDMFYNQYVTSGAGSGVIITTDGYIVTNYHVIDGAKSATVRLTDGSEFSASYVGGDRDNDIAVIKINATGLTAAVLGSSKSLVVGQEVIAIGNPLGSLGGTVTNGIISALDRTVVIDGYKMTLMQTNAAINPGNSGGGLFNRAGELIGIVNAKQSDTGIEGLGFAIPIDVVVDSINTIAKGE